MLKAVAPSNATLPKDLDWFDKQIGAEKIPNRSKGRRRTPRGERPLKDSRQLCCNQTTRARWERLRLALC
jgi:hypothetical protein